MNQTMLDPLSGGDEWAFLCLDVLSTDALPSAQQCMRVLHITQARVLSPKSTKCRACHERASADGEQGRIDGADGGGPSSLCFRVSSVDGYASARRMLTAIRRGGNRLVLREWRGSASWWNLNTNLSLRGAGGGVHRRGSDDSGCATLAMARAEVAGYRLARVCTADLPPSCADDARRADGPWRRDVAPSIPEVVCFSHDESSDVEMVDELTTLQVDLPWALMEYFDDDNDLARTGTAAHPMVVRVDAGLDIETDRNAGDHQSQQTATWTRCDQYPDSMVKVRHEFGFDEPHPRHGRVPETECFDYGMMVLRDAVVPIHCQFFVRRRYNGINPERGRSFFGEFLPHIAISDEGKMRPFQYQDVVLICQRAFEQLNSTVQDERIKSYVEVLGRCIDALKCEWGGDPDGRPPPLPAVLCHMDLQPQNLMFCRRDKSDDICRVRSITDWEEACYADPRFEVLLICRKVLAGPTQAEELWQMYSDRVKELRNDLIVGPLDPWLRLETVHNICTLLLQASDLLGGGRNPWESKPDLLQKIDRESRRLSRMGYPT